MLDRLENDNMPGRPVAASHDVVPADAEVERGVPRPPGLMVRQQPGEGGFNRHFGDIPEPVPFYVCKKFAVP